MFLKSGLFFHSMTDFNFYDPDEGHKPKRIGQLIKLFLFINLPAHFRLSVAGVPALQVPEIFAADFNF